MMKLVAVLTVVFGIAQLVNGYQINLSGATYSCLNDNLTDPTDDAIAFEYTEEFANDTYVQAFIEGMQQIDGCVANKTVDGKIIIIVVIGQCGLQRVNFIVWVHIFLVQTINFVTEWDFKFWFHCDFRLQTMQNVTANLVSISHNVQNGTVTEKVENVTLRVVDDNVIASQQILDTCRLGDIVKLRLDLVPSITAVGTYGINCIVGPDANLLRRLDFITDRCAVTNPANGGVGLPNFQGYLPKDTGFGAEVNIGILFLSATEGFKCFRFADSFSLFFHCKIGFCAARDNQCDMDNCINKPAGKRRRRRDAEVSETEDVLVRIDVSNTGGSQTSTGTVIESQPAECKPEHIYMYNTAFIAVIAILAILLVVSMGSTMFVCMRTRRLRTGGKGEDNLAF